MGAPLARTDHCPPLLCAPPPPVPHLPSPLPCQVDVGVYQDYVFFASPGFKAVQVTLTPVLGDADLYIAINSSLPATKSNADFRSTSIDGAEVITISANDTRVTNKCIVGQGCTIKIGVNGFTNATYVVVYRL